MLLFVAVREPQQGLAVAIVEARRNRRVDRDGLVAGEPGREDFAEMKARQGVVIAGGPPAAIRENAEVRECYLGTLKYTRRA